MAGKLSGKVVIITGASSGIGREAALLFAKEGARLVLAARRESKLAQLSDEIQQLGGEATFVVADLAEREDAEKVVVQTIEQFGSLDILVNNAGFGLQMLVERVSPQDVERIFAVNVLAVLTTIRVAIPHLAKNQGCIINVASIAGLIPMPMHAIYSATKHAIVGLGTSMKSELTHHGIRLATICPGPVLTEFMDVLEGEKFPAWLLKSASLFFDTPQTIAKKIVRTAKKPKSKVILPSFRSWLLTWSYRLCPPLSHLLYSRYAKHMAQEIYDDK